MRHKPRRDVGQDDGYAVRLDAIQDKIRRASHTDWTNAEPAVTAPSAEADNPRQRLSELEKQEQVISKRRRELHKRIDFLEDVGSGNPLNPTFVAQLKAFKRAEERDSFHRRQLHSEIDRLREESGELPTGASGSRFGAGGHSPSLHALPDPSDTQLLRDR